MKLLSRQVSFGSAISVIASCITTLNVLWRASKAKEPKCCHIGPKLKHYFPKKAKKRI